MKKWNNLSVNMKRLLITLFAVPAIFCVTETLARRDNHIIVDQGTCIGCGACVTICPECFDLNDDGKAEPIVDVVPASSVYDVYEAQESCPVQAIYVNF